MDDLGVPLFLETPKWNMVYVSPCGAKPPVNHQAFYPWSFPCLWVFPPVLAIKFPPPKRKNRIDWNCCIFLVVFNTLVSIPISELLEFGCGCFWEGYHLPHILSFKNLENGRLGIKSNSHTKNQKNVLEFTHPRPHLRLGPWHEGCMVQGLWHMTGANVRMEHGETENGNPPLPQLGTSFEVIKTGPGTVFLWTTLGKGQSWKGQPLKKKNLGKKGGSLKKGKMRKAFQKILCKTMFFYYMLAKAPRVAEGFHRWWNTEQK